MISVSNLEKSYGDRTLFAGASFQLNAGERYGLVGANGSGKTTLLNILSGTEEASAGTVSIPKRLRIGTLRQDQFLYEDRQILSVALMGNAELWAAIEAKEALLANAHESFDAEHFSELEDVVQRHDGYTAEARAATVLEGLGLPTEVHRLPLSTLSGGFKLRVLLAQVLASTPDVLLLDEPTNHLDILSIRWLEMFLRDFPGPVVVISHDHRFLDRVVTHILDVDYETVTLYHGDYTAFREGKREDRERREKDIAGRQKEIAHHQEFVDRFRAKNTKARQAQSKLRIIEKKLEGIEELAQSSRRYPTFDFQEKRPSGRDVLTLKGIEKSYGEKRVLHGLDLLVRKGDRLAITGPNGIGKSTLLKIMVGQVEADVGEVKWGYETHPGYFAQDQKEQFENVERTVHEWLSDFAPEKDIGYIRGRLALMLFEGDDVKKRLYSLSGGEAARLVFARLALERPNVLVLDEPTNHLDLESIESLVEGLQKFAGTLILVSHDRWFISQLATRIVDIQPRRVVDYQGTYDEYVQFTGDDHLDTEKVILKAKAEKKRKEGGGSTGATTAEGAGGNGAAASGAGKSQTATSSAGKPQAAGSSAAGGPSTSTRRRNPAEIEREKRKALERHAEVTHLISVAEARIAEIDALFAEPTYYARTAPDEVRRVQEERAGLADEVAKLMVEWERGEETIAALG